MKKLTFLTIQNHPFKLLQPTYLEIITLQKALLLFDSILGGLGDYTNGDKFQTDVGILSEIKKLKSEVHLKNSTINVLNQKVSSTGVACNGRVYILYAGSTALHNVSRKASFTFIYCSLKQGCAQLLQVPHRLCQNKDGGEYDLTRRCDEWLGSAPRKI